MVDSSGVSGINDGDVGCRVYFPPGHHPNGSNSMIESHLKHHLEPVAQRHRELKLWIGLGVAWIALAVVAGLFLFLQRFVGWNTPFTFGVLVAASIVALGWIWRRSQRWQPDFRQVARKIE